MSRSILKNQVSWSTNDLFQVILKYFHQFIGY